QKVSGLPACGTKGGVTRERSAFTAWLGEYQEWEGLCDRSPLHVQSAPPSPETWLHCATSKPPPDAAPSKVSVSVTGEANGPPGSTVRRTRLVSSWPLDGLTARTM